MFSNGDLVGLRAFVAVAQDLSFVRASEQLGVSASALSQTIRCLEARIGVRLFNRTTRSVSLTDVGQKLFDQTGPAFTAVSEALAVAIESQSRPAGTVRVYSPRLAADKFLTPILKNFTSAYPDVVVDITVDGAVSDFVAKGYDVIIHLGEVIEKNFVARRLSLDLKQIAVASPEYIARHGIPDTPRDLTSHTCIRWRWPGEAKPYAWEFYESGRWFSVNVNGSLITTDREIITKSALQGLGIAFLAEDYVCKYIDTGELIPLLIEWSFPFSGFYLSYSDHRNISPATRVFIDTVFAASRRKIHIKQ